MNDISGLGKNICCVISTTRRNYCNCENCWKYPNLLAPACMPVLSWIRWSLECHRNQRPGYGNHGSHSMINKVGIIIGLLFHTLCNTANCTAVYCGKLFDVALKCPLKASFIYRICRIPDVLKEIGFCSFMCHVSSSGVDCRHWQHPPSHNIHTCCTPAVCHIVQVNTLLSEVK